MATALAAHVPIQLAATGEAAAAAAAGLQRAPVQHSPAACTCTPPGRSHRTAARSCRWCSQVAQSRRSSLSYPADGDAADLWSGCVRRPSQHPAQAQPTNDPAEAQPALMRLQGCRMHLQQADIAGRTWKIRWHACETWRHLLQSAHCNLQAADGSSHGSALISGAGVCCPLSTRAAANAAAGSIAGVAAAAPAALDSIEAAAAASAASCSSSSSAASMSSISCCSAFASCSTGARCWRLIPQRPHGPLPG